MHINWNAATIVVNAYRTIDMNGDSNTVAMACKGFIYRVINHLKDQVMEAGVYGVKLELSGRLGGAEMSRKEKASRGSIPLSTLQRHIDYGFAIAKTSQGVIGVKVWIDHGNYSDEEAVNGPDAKAGKTSKNPKRSHKR